MLKHGSQNSGFVGGGTQTILGSNVGTYQQWDGPTPNSKMGAHDVSASFIGVVT